MHKWQHSTIPSDSPRCRTVPNGFLSELTPPLVLKKPRVDMLFNGHFIKLKPYLIFPT